MTNFVFFLMFAYDCTLPSEGARVNAIFRRAHNGTLSAMLAADRVLLKKIRLCSEIA
jgi:hypothetical protein